MVKAKKKTKKVSAKPKRSTKTKKAVKKTIKKLPTHRNFSEDFNDFFAMSPFESFFKPIDFPSSDIIDNGKTLEVTIDLPGINKKDIKITVQKNFLEVKAEKKIESKTKKQNYFAQERSYSGYYRRFVLPVSVDSNKTKCDFSNGVLKITLPKLKETKDKAKVITLK